MSNKEQIFHKPKAREISEGKPERVIVKSIDEAVELASRQDSFGKLILPRDVLIIIDAKEQYLVPEEYTSYKVNKKKRVNEDDESDNKSGLDEERIYFTRSAASRKFMKHGEEIYFPRFHSKDEAVKAMRDTGKIPRDLLKERFSQVSGPRAAVSYMPIFGNDGRKRKFHLNEIIEGTKLYGYIMRQGFPVKIELYQDAKRVDIEGAIARVTVPSRIPHRENYKFNLYGIPVINDDSKYALSMSLISNHLCTDVQHRDRFTWDYGKENSKLFNWDAHDIAGYYLTLDHFSNPRSKVRNKVPLEMSIIPMPAQLLVDIHEIMRYQTLVYTKETKNQEKAKLYPLNNAEIEIGLQKAVPLLGHDATLVSYKSRDGNLRDYQFRIPF